MKTTSKKSSTSTSTKSSTKPARAKQKSYRTPKIHVRMKSDKSSPVRCQRRSQSNLWSIELQSVAPKQLDKATCGRCRRAQV